MYTKHDWHAAQRDVDVAARLLRRRSPEVLVRQTRLLSVLGRIDEAIALERATIKDDPTSNWAWAQLGYHLAITGHPVEAQAALARAVQFKPEDDHIPYYQGVAWLIEGKSAEAIAAFGRSGSVFRLAGLAAAHHEAGNEVASLAALETLKRRYGPSGAYQVAQAYAWRGEPDKAFEWLGRAEAQQDGGLATLKSDPMMRKLHGDPRYRAWLVKLKLDDEAALKRL